MNEPVILTLIGLAVVGLLATLLIMRRQRKSGEAASESQYSVSTEGESTDYFAVKAGIGFGI